MVHLRRLSACRAALLSLLAIGEAGAGAPALVETRWNIEDGLPQERVVALAQDGEGRLWIGSEGGLAVFDGNALQPVALRPAANEESVAALAFDATASTLWIATRTGLLRRLGDGSLRAETPRLPAAARVQALAVDGRGAVWLGTTGGLLTGTQGSAFGGAGTGASARGNVRALLLDRRGRLWAGGDFGLDVLAGGRTTAIVLGGGERRSVSALVEDAQGDVWIGCSGSDAQLFRMRDGVVVERIAAADHLPATQVQSLLATREGDLWVGTRRGLALHRGGGFMPLPRGVEPGGGTVTALFQSREGALWAGSEARGLVRLHRSPVTEVWSALGETEGMPMAITTARAGGLWVGTRGRGLVRLRDGAIVERHAEPVGQITALWQDDDGSLWITLSDHARGLWRLRDGRMQAVVKPGALRGALALHRDSRGVLHVGDADGLATVLDAGEVHRAREPTVPVRALFEDGRGRLWVASARGLLRATDRGFVTLGVTQGLPHETVTALGADAQGRSWVMTVAGAARWDEQAQRFIPLAAAAQLSTCGGVGDRAGAFWIATARGLLRVGATASSGAAEVGAVIPFGRGDGLPTPSCQRGSSTAAVGPQGQPWFVTRGGLALVEPGAVPTGPAPPVRIDSALRDGQPLTVGADLTIAPRARTLELRFSAVRLVGAERTVLRYRLQGYDHEWRLVVGAAAGQVRYGQLPAGRMVFEVAAANEEGDFGAVTRLRLRVLPAVHQTVWFWSALVLLVAVVCWQVLRARESRVRERHRTVLDERSRVARELHDTLLQGFAGVLFQLRGVQTLIPQDPGRAVRTLDEAMAHGRGILGETRRTIMDIRAPGLASRGIAELLEETVRRAAAPAAVELTARTLPALPERLKEGLVRIAEEAARNALRHGAARRVTVRLQPEGDGLLLEIHDDGNGFDPSRPRGERAQFGILGMTERARLLGGRCELASQPGAGTTVSVRLPLGDSGASPNGVAS